MVEEAEQLAKAGCFAVVLECLPNELAEAVTKRLQPLGVATIGIGAGTACSGQVLVCADLLGLSPHTPRFARQYLTLGPMIKEAFAEYRKDVEQGSFPDEARMPKPMCPKELNELHQLLQENYEGAEQKKTKTQIKSTGESPQVGSMPGMADPELHQILKNNPESGGEGARSAGGSLLSFLGAAGGGAGGLLLSQRGRGMLTKAEEQ